MSYLCIAVIQSTELFLPPQNVQANTLSSTKIIVTWEEVPTIGQNGVIINYEVEYEPLQFTEQLNTSTINATDLTVAIVGLEYIIYTHVAAVALTPLTTHPQMQAELVRPPVRGQEQEQPETTQS